jgi:ribonuclease HII
MDNTFDRLFYQRGRYIGGVDETGISDIAGPLIAACVILPRYEDRPDDVRLFDVDDCKKLPERSRKKLAEIIWQAALGIGIGEVTPTEVDALGREASTRLAMLRSVIACRAPGTNKPVRPDFLLVDSAQDLHIAAKIRQMYIQKGDSKSLCIAAASVIAKVYRDDIMIKLHQSYPYYDWISNKGFPSTRHLEGLDKHGLQIGIHRVKGWPFIKNPRLGEESNQAGVTNNRRKMWRKITEQKLAREVGEDLWTLKPQSFRDSPKSSPPMPSAL